MLYLLDEGRGVLPTAHNIQPLTFQFIMTIIQLLEKRQTQWLSRNRACTNMTAAMKSGYQTSQQWYLTYRSHTVLVTSTHSVTDTILHGEITTMNS